MFKAVTEVKEMVIMVTNLARVLAPFQLMFVAVDALHLNDWIDIVEAVGNEQLEREKQSSAGATPIVVVDTEMRTLTAFPMGYVRHNPFLVPDGSSETSAQTYTRLPQNTPLYQAVGPPATWATTVPHDSHFMPFQNFCHLAHGG